MQPVACKSKLRMRLLSLFIGLAALVSVSHAAGVLAIDYGTEWMKVSLLKPGIPFDVLLNTYVGNARFCYRGEVLIQADTVLCFP